jgi:hypothetical protein
MPVPLAGLDKDVAAAMERKVALRLELGHASPNASRINSQRLQSGATKIASCRRPMQALPARLYCSSWYALFATKTIGVRYRETWPSTVTFKASDRRKSKSERKITQ